MPTGVYKRKPLSEETKRKISAANKGRPPWITGKKWSEDIKKKLSKKRLENKKKLGYINSEETRIKMGLAHKGRKVINRKKPKEFTLEHRKRMGESRMGENHWNWKGGDNRIMRIIRTSFEYRLWRSDVHRRDNFTCQECGKRGGRLDAHHIKKLSLIIKENNILKREDIQLCPMIYDINNGQTLCVTCHKKTDSYLKRN